MKEQSMALAFGKTVSFNGHSLQPTLANKWRHKHQRNPSKTIERERKRKKDIGRERERERERERGEDSQRVF
jgi:hypothetical protein